MGGAARRRGTSLHHAATRHDRLSRSEEHAIEVDHCLPCGACCRNIPFVELTPADITLLAEATGLSPDHFTNAKRTDPEEHFLRFDADGDCMFLDASSPLHVCTVYEARPAVCRAYPATREQVVRCDELSASSRARCSGAA